METPKSISLLQGLQDLPLYIRSFFSKTAIYRASYIKQDVRSVDSKSVVSISLHPVFFEEGDKIKAPILSEATIIPNSNLIRSKIVGDLIYDEDNQILFSLDARLIGKKQKTSLLDISQNNKGKVSKTLAFLAHLIGYDGDTVKLGSIHNRQPVDYKDLVCQSLSISARRRPPLSEA